MSGRNAGTRRLARGPSFWDKRAEEPSPALHARPRGSLIVVAVEIPEKALIAKIRRLAKSTTNAAVMTGIGDDCAVLRLRSRSGERGKNKPKQNDVLVTTDFSLEGIHFRRDWHSAESVGHRCLARGLSDIAA